MTDDTTVANALIRIATALEESTKIKREYADKMNTRSNPSPGNPVRSTSNPNPTSNPAKPNLATQRQLNYLHDLYKRVGQNAPADLGQISIPEASARISELKAKVFRH
jgi:hypothetical protein